jgi:hypothetical protein
MTQQFIKEKNHLIMLCLEQRFKEQNTRLEIIPTHACDFYNASAHSNDPITSSIEYGTIERS